MITMVRKNKETIDHHLQNNQDKVTENQKKYKNLNLWLFQELQDSLTEF